MKKGHLIKSVDPGSIAEEMELEPGDVLLTIDGDEIEDIFDVLITSRRMNQSFRPEVFCPRRSFL